MAEEGQQRDLAGSSATFPTDSENYSSSNNDLSPSPPSSSRSPMILYSPPTFWGLLRGAAINLLLPFINGLMLGFGELLAHEAAFRLGWSGTKVRATSLLLYLWGIVDEREPIGPNITLLLCNSFANSTIHIDLPKWPDSEVCWTRNRSARQSSGTQTAGARVGGYDLSGMKKCILETRLYLYYLH